jgi:hypothetical protein
MGRKEIEKYNIHYFYEKRLKQQQQPFLKKIHVNVEPPHATTSLSVVYVSPQWAERCACLPL